MAYSNNKKLRPRIRQAFAENGWCPRQVDYLRNTFDNKVLRYLSSLDRKFRNISHAICEESTHCSAYNVDRETYEPAHTSDCSAAPGSCTLVGVDTGRLIDTIQKGKAPLISIEINDNGNLSLRITPRDHEIKYIAISHVWSDGLGNPRGNALPSCQLKKLVRKLKRLPKAHPKLIWMDTLCVPVAPQHSYYRKQEIKRMPSIYAGATTILVLDSELQRIYSSAIHPVEILARIICSVWMQRCWTLEEGIVSRRCLFQFKDKPIDLPVFLSESPAFSSRYEDNPTEITWTVQNTLRLHLWERLHYGRNGGMQCNYHGKESLQRQNYVAKVPTALLQAIPFVDSMVLSSEYDLLTWNERRGPSYLALQLVRTWNELAHRSTSRVEDIYAIMASVLGFSPERIMNLQSNAQRLQALLFSLPSLPVSLFFNTGPRHKQGEVHNNRWVPEEISHYMPQEGGTVSFTSEGLHLDFHNKPDIYVVAGVFSNEISFHISTQPEAVYEVRLFHDDSSGNNALRSRYKSICIMLECPLSGNIRHTRGALFRIHGTDVDGISLAKLHTHMDLIFDCPLDIYRARPIYRGLNVKETIKVEHTSKVSVRYDKIPCFEVLPRRPNSHMALMFYPIVWFVKVFSVGFLALVEFGVYCLGLSVTELDDPSMVFGTMFFCIICLLLLIFTYLVLNRLLEGLAYRTWLELFDYDVPEAQQSLQWKLWWNIMDDGKYAHVRWGQWGAS